MVDKGTKRDISQQEDSYYPTPSTIPAGTRCLTFHVPDSAEWYGLAVGAMWELMRSQNYEKAGLDIDLVVDRWLEVFNTMEVNCMDIIPVGATMTWHMQIPPARWLLCDGGLAFVAEYPELFALWGYKYGGVGGQFGLLDMRNLSPMGAEGGQVGLDGEAGALTHTLTSNEMPSHTHGMNAPFTSIIGARPAGGGAATAGSTLAGGGTLANTGGGLPHNNLHPVKGVNWIVYGGRAV